MTLTHPSENEYIFSVKVTALADQAISGSSPPTSVSGTTTKTNTNFPSKWAMEIFYRELLDKAQVANWDLVVLENPN